MISTSQKEHLTYTLILQCTILIWVGILAWMYIFPWISKINAATEWAEQAITEYNNVRKNGIPIETIGQELSKVEWKEELLKIIRSAQDDARKVITKTGEGDYLDWLNSSILSSDEDKKKLTQAKQKINSILPTMSPISNSVDQEYITLKEYTQFIEKRFLDEFEIGSTVVIGLQWVTYPRDINPSTIGVFDLRLDFRATNSNIQRLITYVNESGNPEILSFTGILTEWKIPKIFSNPLMTVESLSLENVLDSTKPDAINTGRVTIRFYVRGSSIEDIKFLKESIIAKRDKLEKSIAEAIVECREQDFCATTLPKYEEFQKKWKEYTRSLWDTKWVESGDIVILGQVARGLKWMSDEFEAIIKPIKK